MKRGPSSARNGASGKLRSASIASATSGCGSCRRSVNASSAIDVTKGDVDIRDGDDKAEWLLSDLRNQGCLRHQKRFHLLRHVIGLGFGERHKAPILLPGLIIDGTNSLTLPRDIFEVNRPDLDPLFSRACDRNLPQTLRGRRKFGEPCVIAY